MNQMSLKWKIITKLQHRFNRRYNWRAEQYFQIDEKEHMITKEHLKHWISELNWALRGISNEVHKQKINGIKTDEAYFSFEYVKEKVIILQGTIRCIEDDIKND